MRRVTLAVRRKYLANLPCELQFGIDINKRTAHFPVVERFINEVFIPEAMRHGTPAVYAALIATDRYMPDIERMLADLRPSVGTVRFVRGTGLRTCLPPRTSSTLRRTAQRKRFALATCEPLRAMT